MTQKQINARFDRLEKMLNLAISKLDGLLMGQVGIVVEVKKAGKKRER